MHSPEVQIVWAGDEGVDEGEAGDAQAVVVPAVHSTHCSTVTVQYSKNLYSYYCSSTLDGCTKIKVTYLKYEKY